MIDTKILEQVTTIVTHEGCADGVASALILKDVLPGAEVVFVQYNTDAWRNLTDRTVHGLVLFCDMTPPREDARLFADDGSIVLDHHRGAKDIVDMFGDRGVFADEETEPGVSGALLAYRHVWVPMHGYRGARSSGHAVNRLACLAGVRDTWQRNDPRWEEACAQAAALRFWPWEDLKDLYLMGDVFDFRLEIGPILLKKEALRVERSISDACRFTVGKEKLRVVAFEGTNTSDVADRLEGEVDLVLGWHYRHEKGPEMVVSCRSRGSFSARLFAQQNGGGGHERAAGFTLSLSDDSENPYRVLKEKVASFLA